MNNLEQKLLEDIQKENNVENSLLKIRNKIDTYLNIEYFLTWKYLSKTLYQLIQDSEDFKEYLEEDCNDLIEIEISTEQEYNHTYLTGYIGISDLNENFDYLLNDLFSSIQINKFFSEEKLNIKFPKEISFENFEDKILKTFCNNEYLVFLEKTKLEKELSINKPNKRNMKI